MLKVIRETCIAGAVIDRTVKGSRRPEMQKRAPKMNPTPEAVRKNNDRIAAKNLARDINANFFPGDYHVTLTYAYVPSRDQAQRELNNWIRRMKREFEKAGKEFKWVAVTEYEKTRIHHHIVMSYIDNRIINGQWKNGKVLFSTLDKSRNYTKLANYLIKETQRTFRDADNAVKRRYSSSRNLVKPVVVVEKVSASQLFADPKPLKGYVIDTDSIKAFENPITGMNHIEYSMVSTEPVPRIKKWRKGKIAKRTESLSRFEALKQLDIFEADYWMR